MHLTRFAHLAFKLVQDKIIKDNKVAVKEVKQEFEIFYEEIKQLHLSSQNNTSFGECWINKVNSYTPVSTKLQIGLANKKNEEYKFPECFCGGKHSNWNECRVCSTKPVHT